MDASEFILVTKDTPWSGSGVVASTIWKCGYCNREVGSNVGWKLTNGRVAQGEMFIRLCSVCNAPTLFLYGDQKYSPGPLPGRPVEHVPQEVDSLFWEARAACAAGAYTASVLTCRKILMHVAVEQGAAENKSFLHYVEHLVEKGFVPPGSKRWLDYIRKRSNDANHDILLMSTEDATVLVTFTELLLRFVYELPNSVPEVPEVMAPE